jgi:CheY-like chemotaxis protein
MNEHSTQILLVEDNLADAELIRRLFARVGQQNWQMVHVETLAEGIEVCYEYAELMKGNRSFDVVLLDLSLPDAEGLEAIQAFQSALPELPIVVLTGLGDEDLASQAVRAGAKDYLVKDETTIQQLMRAILSASNRTDANRRSQDSHD